MFIFEVTRGQPSCGSCHSVVRGLTPPSGSSPDENEKKRAAIRQLLRGKAHDHLDCVTRRSSHVLHHHLRRDNDLLGASRWRARAGGGRGELHEVGRQLIGIGVRSFGGD